MLTLNVPATFGLVVLAEPIVRLLFERGSFSAADTAGHGRRGAALRARPGRLLGGQDRVADLLRHRPQPHAGRRRRRRGAAERRAQRRQRAGLRLPGPGAQRVDRRAVQRRRAGVAGARRPRRPRTARASSSTGTKMLVAVRRDGRRRRGGRCAGSSWWCRGRRCPGRWPGSAGAIAASLAVLAAAAHLLRVREFEEIRDAVIGPRAPSTGAALSAAQRALTSAAQPVGRGPTARTRRPREAGADGEQPPVRT